MTRFLCTYRPICASPEGRQAIERFAIPPFVDASCRREPDFESRLPSISALCRGGMFAPRLKPGDTVVYAARKDRYGVHPEDHWRLVAVLRVVHWFSGHAAAAEWYREEGLPLPSNCMVEGNPPLPLERTGGPGKATLKQLGYPSDPERAVRAWDYGYRTRAGKWGAFLVCEPTWVELWNPPVLTPRMARAVFGGRMPATQNPRKISDEAFERLAEITRSHGQVRDAA